MSLYSQLFLRETGSPYGDITRNSTLSFKDLDQNFIFLKERDINQLKIVGSNLIYETLGGTEYSVNIGGASTNNTFVTGFTFNSPLTYDLTIEQNQGEPPLTVDLSSLASDVYVLSGSYDPSTGDVEFTNSTGGTFVVSGFTTGMTDSYTDDATLNGNIIEFDNNIQGSNYYNVDLTPVISGFTTGNTLQEVLDNGSTATISSGNFNVEYSTASVTSRVRVDSLSSYLLSSGTGSTSTIFGGKDGVIYLQGDYGLNNKEIRINPTQMLVTDAESTKGLEYASDYSSNFTNESLVTKRYVTGVTSNFAIVGTYTNGYVPRWNATTNTLESGTIQDSGNNVHVGGIPDATAKLKVSKGSGTDEGIYVDVTNGGGNGARIEMKNSSGTTNQTGLYVRNFSNSSASGDIRGINILTETDTTSKTINNVFGIHAQNMDLNANTTVNNLYQLFLGDAGSAVKGTGDFYGIYQSSASIKNYFAGDVGIGNAPLSEAKLTVNNGVSLPSAGANITGAYVGARGTGSNTLYGLSVEANKEGSGGETKGIYVKSTANNTSSTVSVLHGLDMDVTVGTGAATNVRGLNLNLENSTGTVTGDIHGIYIEGIGGTIGGTKYGIYQQGNGDKNYFGGQLQLNTIGSGTPVTNLGVDASGNVVSGTSGEITTATNIGSGEGLFSGKSGVELQFKTLTSTGGTVTITSTGDTVNLESSGGGGGTVSFSNTYRIPFMNSTNNNFDYSTGFTYNGTYLSIIGTGTQDLLFLHKNSSSTTNFFNVIARGDVTGAIDSLGYKISRVSTTSVAFGSTTNHPLTLFTNNNTSSNVITLYQSGNVKIGDDNISDDGGSKLYIRGSGDTISGSNLKLVNNSENTLFEVKNDGTVVIPNIGSTPSVTNLGVDASGNVVSGTTGGGGGSGLNYITSGGTVANNLELTSNWDINGVYTGSTTATGTQSDCHVDSNYWFTCVATNTWIRLIRG